MSGREDLNLRPPGPDSDSITCRNLLKAPVSCCFRLKPLPDSAMNSLKSVELRCFDVYKFIYIWRGTIGFTPDFVSSTPIFARLLRLLRSSKSRLNPLDLYGEIVIRHPHPHARHRTRHRVGWPCCPWDLHVSAEYYAAYALALIQRWSLLRNELTAFQVGSR